MNARHNKLAQSMRDALGFGLVEVSHSTSLALAASPARAISLGTSLALAASRARAGDDVRRTAAVATPSPRPISKACRHGADDGRPYSFGMRQRISASGSIYELWLVRGDRYWVFDVNDSFLRAGRFADAFPAPPSVWLDCL